MILKEAIENYDNLKLRFFYCKPCKSNQKGSCEVNYELIRKVLPQGTSNRDFFIENCAKKEIIKYTIPTREIFT